MQISDKIRELRIEKGLTQEELSLLSGFSKSYIQKFEENKRELKSSHVVKLASALRVPITAFLSGTNFSTGDYVFKNIEFREKNNIIDVESFKKSVIGDLYVSYNAYHTLEDILNDRKVFLNPVKENELIYNTANVEDIATKLRKKWKFGKTPIYDLIGFLEDLGIKIFEVERDNDFVGFSCWMKKTPVIVVNIANKDVARRRFTVLHELAHLLLNFPSGSDNKIIEKCCDQFAGAMLLPGEILKEYLNSSSISLEELKRIKAKYGISISAILVRMVSIGYIDWDKYREWQELYLSWTNKNGGFYGKESAGRFDYLLAKALRERKITDAKASELVKRPISEIRDIYLSKEFS